MDNHTNKKIPNPGTEEAQKLGCKCPMIDNHFGKGVRIKGKIVFWYNGDCKPHRTTI
jgi:hypothetical protein